MTGVHLLLPPSEGKRPGGRGRSLTARPDTGPLADARARMITALTELARGDPAQAARDLLLPDGVAADALVADRSVTTSATMPALRRYSGVVYDGLNFDSLTAPEQRLALRSTWIFSGLFGVLRGDESVPLYRVPAKATLPGVGVASTYWRRVLTPYLPTVLRRGLVVDLRSSDYAAMWRPDAATAARAVSVRVLSPAPRGGHAVISYASKLGKGRLAAALIRRAAAGAGVDTADDVVAAWLDAGGKDARSRDGALDLHDAL